MKNKRLYRIWKAMRTRCNNPNFQGYKYYGGKGVSICKQWGDFFEFQKWALENGYEEHLTIDRKNSDGNYEPSNCRFITLGQQQGNRSSVKKVDFKGELMTFMKIADRYHIPHQVIYSRYTKGLRNEELVKPVRKATILNIRGENLTLKEISEKYNIPYSTIRYRNRNGINDEKIIKKNLGWSYQC